MSCDKVTQLVIIALFLAITADLIALFAEFIGQSCEEKTDLDKEEGDKFSINHHLSLKPRQKLRRKLPKLCPKPPKL
jgi:hypothetical protein